MATRFASAKNSIALCDRCSFQYRLRELRALTIKTKLTNIMVCPTCWEPDQPQTMLGMYPVDDPQAVRNPRPDNSYWQSGYGGLQLTASDYGTPGEGSRVIQWGWAPVGLNDPLDLSGLTNTLVAVGDVGTVIVS